MAEPYRLPDSIKIGNVSTAPSSTIPTKQTECQALNTQVQIESHDVTQSQPLKQTLSSFDTTDNHDSSRSTDDNPPPSHTSNTAPSLSPSLPSSPPPPPKKKVMGPSLPIRQKITDKEQEDNQWQEDENYASWLPPEGMYACLSDTLTTVMHFVFQRAFECCSLFAIDQTGDGRTKLNEKFGY